MKTINSKPNALMFLFVLLFGYAGCNTIKAQNDELSKLRLQLEDVETQYMMSNDGSINKSMLSLKINKLKEQIQNVQKRASYTTQNRTCGASNRHTVQQLKTIYNRLPNDIVKYYKTNDNIVTKFSYGYQVSPYGGVSHCIVMSPGPYLIVFFGYEVYPEYFEIKDTYRWVRIARDLSWVQNYPGFLYNHPATEAEYLKFEKTYIPVPGAISPTPGSTSSGNISRNNTSPSKGVGCHLCNYTGINPNPCTGGCLYAFRAPYTANSAGTRCSICGNGTNHHHDWCANCNAPSR